MNAKQLKRSVLQHAMQGKFFSNQEAFTQRNREQIINSAINPKFQSGPFSDEEFNLPPNWSCFRLGEVIKVKSGKHLPNSKMIEGPIPVYGGNGLNGFHNEYFIEENSLIIGRVGAQCGNVHITEQKAWVTDNALIVDFPKDSVDIKFLAYLLEFLELGKHSSSTAQPVISGRKIYPLPIAIPLLEEQMLIVKKIEDIFSKIDFYQSLYISAERTRNEFPNRLEKSILQYAMAGKLVEQDTSDEPASELLKRISEQKEQMIKEKVIKKEKSLPPITEEEIPFDIPDTWEWVRLGSIFNINPRNTIEDELTVSFMPMALLDEGYRNSFTFNIKKWQEVKRGYTHFKNGDLLIAKITPCFQNLKSAIATDLENGFGAGTTELHVLRPYIDLHLPYFLWFVKNPLFVNDCVKNMSGTAGQQRVGKNYIANYLVPIPPLKEQIRISDKIEHFFKATSLLKK